MYFHSFLLSTIVLGFSNALYIPHQNASDSLVLVHTLFRHGNRTIEDNIYDTNPYGDVSFYAPYGYAQLTNTGKQTEFKIGEALRARYDSLIGPEWSIDLIGAQSTNVDRTKMSLLLVLASLFPPTEDLKWNDKLNWLPIPFNASDADKALNGRKACVNYDEKFDKVIKTDEVLAYLKPYQNVFDYLTEQAGYKIQKAKKVADLYIELKIQEAFGYPVEEWTQTYKEEMFNLTIYTYKLMAYTKKLKRLSTGYLLRKIIEDTEYLIDNPTSARKMYLYSAHEKNIATLLVTLDVFDDQIPSFGSYVTFEVHNIDEVYGLKLFYQNYYNVEPVLLTIPGCSEFCSLADFSAIFKDLIPDDDYCELADD